MPNDYIDKITLNNGTTYDIKGGTKLYRYYVTGTTGTGTSQTTIYGAFVADIYEPDMSSDELKYLMIGHAYFDSPTHSSHKAKIINEK